MRPIMPGLGAAQALRARLIGKKVQRGAQLRAAFA
jgi:hypothetical protein